MSLHMLKTRTLHIFIGGPFTLVGNSPAQTFENACGDSHGRAKPRRIGTVLLLVIGMLVAAATRTAHAQETVTVTVPGNASGALGNPVSLVVPLVAAISVSGPSPIQVTYVRGTVNVGPFEVGPNGAPYTAPDDQYPLQEAQGIQGGTIQNLGALIGVFVPKYRVEDRRGFKAIDGTKNLTRVGIKPYFVHFIGAARTLSVKEAGTLFLGINDNIADDNSGSFTVQVTAP